MAGPIRQNCKWLPVRSAERGMNSGPELNEFDHPDLLRSMRGLSAYLNWIDTRLLPIANKWIDEHREDVISGMTPEEMDDMGAAIEKAFQIVSQSEWYLGQVRKASAIDIQAALAEGRANPLWVKKTSELMRAEESVLSCSGKA